MVECRSAGPVHVVEHPGAHGSGTALRAGLKEARERGCTHVVSVARGGRLTGEERAAIAEALRRDPGALIVGVRDLAGLRDRLRRLHATFWIWLLTGTRVRDTGSGVCAYPVKDMDELVLKGRFETEMLVKALWRGVPLGHAAVVTRCHRDGRSWFARLRDAVALGRTRALLLLQRVFVPPVALSVLHLREVNDRPLPERVVSVFRLVFLTHADTPGGLAVGIGVGVACGILPIWGFQMATAVFLAHRWRLSKALTLAASNISVPPMIPFILYASLILGRMVLTGEADCSLRVGEVSMATVWGYAREYLVGSVLLAIAAGTCSASCVYTLAWLWGRIGNAPAEK